MKARKEIEPCICGSFDHKHHPTVEPKDGMAILADQINKARPQHTPPPWELSRNKVGVPDIWKGDIKICDVEGSGNLSKEINDGNAALIVRCTNNHQKLVDALKNIRALFKENSSTVNMIDEVLTEAQK